MRRDGKWKSFWVLISACFALMLLVSCGGSDGGGAATTSTVSGIAAAGAPIIGTINIRGANGNTSFSAIESDGSFRVDVSALVAPFVVWAEGSANGKEVKLYSTISNPGIVNVTPITNAIVAMALDSDPDEYFKNGTPVPPSDADLELAKQAIFNLLHDVFDSLSMPEDFDLMNGEFVANGTGFDKLLDVMSLPIENGAIEIIDNSTGTTLYEEDLATGVVAEEKTPAEVDSIIGSSLTVLDSLESDMQMFTDLFATGVPTLTELQNQLRPIMSTTFLDDGYDAEDTISLMATGDAGPPPGIEILGISIHRIMKTQYFTVGDTPVQIDEKRGNFAGVWATIRIGLGNQTGDVITSYVQETQGGDWKWNGNQCPFSNGGDISAQADRWISSGGTQIDSGLDVIIEDVGNIAKDNFGIIGAVIMNDALPTIGQTNYHGLIVERPEEIITQYEIINAPSSGGGSVYCESCGLDIDSIGDMEFVYIGYDEFDNPQLVWINLLVSKPIKGSILAFNQDKYFPVINSVAGKSPSSQFNATDLQDSVIVSFTPVTGYSVEDVRLSWGNNGNYIIMHIENPNGQDPSWLSATFDTSSPSIWPPTNAWVSVWYDGDFEREFASYYELELQ